MSRTLSTIVTPQGALRLESDEADGALREDVAARLEAAFARGSGRKLVQLGFVGAEQTLADDLAYWRGFASRFIARLCRAEGEAAPDSPAWSLANRRLAPSLRR
jgi:hypothetical protein